MSDEPVAEFDECPHTATVMVTMTVDQAKMAEDATWHAGYDATADLFTEAVADWKDQRRAFWEGQG